MKDNNFYQVQGWMINQLHLSGNELICFSIIYGFSQDGESLYRGSINYLKGWMNASVPTVIKCLKKLVEKGYIIKQEEICNKVRLCFYKVNENIQDITKETLESTKGFLEGGTKETLVGGTKETLDNNKYNNKENNKENIYKEKIKELSEAESNFQKGMKEHYPHICKMEKPLTLSQYNILISKYDVERVKNTLQDMENWKQLVNKNREAYRTADNWLRRYTR